jgi:hypothetical protein
MTQEEAKGFGISEAERRYLIRLDSAKVNLAPPAADASWFKLVGVRIGNPKTPLYPHGDTVQTVEIWEPPNLWAGLPHPLLNQMLDVIEKGLPNGQLYSSNNAAKQRAAWPVVRDLAPAKAEGEARRVIAAWVATGLLYEADYTDPERGEPAKGLRVNATKRPT